MNDLLLRLMAQFEAKKGQTMVEYGLILALISIAAVGILLGLGTQVANTFNTASASL